MLVHGAATAAAADCRLGLGLELQGDYEQALYHVARLHDEYVSTGQPAPEQLSRDMQRLATALQQQRHPGLAEAEQRDADSTAASSSSSSSSSSTRQMQADQQPVVAAAPAAAATVPAFTGMRAGIPVNYSSDSEEESEEGNETHEPAANDPQASSSAQSSSDAAAARGKIAVVEFDSSSEEEDENAAVQEQHLPEIIFGAEAEAAPAADLAQPPSEAGGAEASAGAAAAAAVTFEAATAATNDESAADVSVGDSAVIEQQLGPGLHQRSRSVGQEGVLGTDDDDAAAAALKGLLEASNMSRHQLQQAGSSSSDSSTSSSSDELVDAAAVERLVQAAQRQQQQQQSEGTAHLAQALQQLQQKQKQLGRQQQWQLMRQQWWQRLQQEHPQAVAEVISINKSENEVFENLLINSKSSSDNKVGDALYKRDNSAAASREAGENALKQGNTQAALKHYNAAIAAVPTDARSYAARAQIWMRLKRPQHAEQDCGMALLLATAPRQEQSNLMLVSSKGDGDAVDLALLGRVRRVRAMAWKELGKLKEAVGVSEACSTVLFCSFWCCSSAVSGGVGLQDAGGVSSRCTASERARCCAYFLVLSSLVPCCWLLEVAACAAAVGRLSSVSCSSSLLSCL
jgi:hypothetical protein